MIVSAYSLQTTCLVVDQTCQELDYDYAKLRQSHRLNSAMLLLFYKHKESWVKLRNGKSFVVCVKLEQGSFSPGAKPCDRFDIRRRQTRPFHCTTCAVARKAEITRVIRNRLRRTSELAPYAKKIFPPPREVEAPLFPTYHYVNSMLRESATLSFNVLPQDSSKSQIFLHNFLEATTPSSNDPPAQYLGEAAPAVENLLSDFFYQWYGSAGRLLVSIAAGENHKINNGARTTTQGVSPQQIDAIPIPAMVPTNKNTDVPKDRTHSM